MLLEQVKLLINSNRLAINRSNPLTRPAAIKSFAKKHSS